MEIFARFVRAWDGLVVALACEIEKIIMKSPSFSVLVIPGANILAYPVGKPPQAHCLIPTLTVLWK